VIGIDAYYGLAPNVPKGTTPTVAEIKASWYPITFSLS